MPRPELPPEPKLSAEAEKSFFSLGYCAQHFGASLETIRAVMRTGAIPVAIEINGVAHVDGCGFVALSKALRRK